MLSYFKAPGLKSIAHFLEREINRRAGSFLTQYLKFLGQRNIWELLMMGEVFISGSCLQRITDISP